MVDRDPQRLRHTVVLAEEAGVTAFTAERANLVGDSDFTDVSDRQDDILRWNPELYAMEFLSDKAMHWCSRNNADWRDEVEE